MMEFGISASSLSDDGQTRAYPTLTTTNSICTIQSKANEWSQQKQTKYHIRGLKDKFCTIFSLLMMTMKWNPPQKNLN